MKGYETARKAIILSFAALALSFSTTVFAQTPKVKSPVVVVVPNPTPPRFPRSTPAPRKRRVPNDSPTPAEKWIQTDAKVNVSIPCIAEGNIRINGWERNEIRAYVSGGSKIGFKVLQKKNQTPVWVSVLGFDPATDKDFDLDECISGVQIEIDVPRGAVINLKSRESQISIESVAKVKVENIGGDISLNNITNGVEAGTYEGDVMVEKSAGAMTLFSTTGNIVAFDVEPIEVGDVFRAKTRSGAVTLQSVAHAAVEIGSASGSILFKGEFASGGRYVFNTTNGSILLLVPADTSAAINANYGFGAFQSEIPLKDVQKIPGAQAQKLTGLLGAGECNLNLTTFSGAIAIRVRKK